MNLELLKTFCGTDETRPHAMEPWSDGEWSYATDGAILVRVPRLAEVTRITPAGLPLRAVEATPAGPVWYPVAVPETMRRATCPDCNGKKVVEWRWAECHKIDACPVCEGRGWVVGQAAVEIGGQCWRADLLIRLLALPGPVEIAPGGGPAACVRFAGGAAWIAPTRPEVAA